MKKGEKRGKFCKKRAYNGNKQPTDHLGEQGRDRAQFMRHRLRLLPERDYRERCSGNMRENSLFRLASVALVSFGLGILLSFFVPSGVLVVIEALLIITIGCMTLLKH